MPAERAKSPFAFLTALSGQSLSDRQIVAATRGAEVKIVSHMVLASKVSTLYAFSGNGKSSLISAGLIPSFLDLGFAVFKTRPRPPYALSNPTEAFKEGCIRDNRLPASDDDRSALLEAARAQLKEVPEDAIPSVRRLVERFATAGMLGPTIALERSAGLSAHLRKHIDLPLPDFLGAAREFLGAEVPMVVVCDQFEELFVHYYNSPVLRSFAEALRDLCDAGNLQIHILFSMREDWVGSMITLRDVIPDILNSAYRLDPMRVSVAAPALTIPAERAGVPIKPDATNQILKDLATFYRDQQRIVSHMSASVESDPFIELPALQIVGDRLWSALPDGAASISKSHYAALAKPEQVGRSGSVAAAVLERYLFDILDAIDAEERRADSLCRDLRVDALYLLTDKAAHRRALSRAELLGELKTIRASVDAMPSASGDRNNVQELERALQPLLARRLVQVSDGGSEGPRYELAHDFMVRSIVRAWSALDLRRAEERGLQEERRRQASERLRTLSQFVVTGNRLLYGLLGVTGIAFIAFGMALHDDFGWLSRVQVFVAAVSAAVLTAAWIMRNRAATIFGISALLTVFTTPSFGRGWPESNFLLNQWLLVLTCLVPTISVARIDARLTAVTSQRWRTVIALSLDYGFFAAVVAVVLSVAGHDSSSDDKAVIGSLVLATLLAGVQLVLVLWKKVTLGHLLIPWLSLRHPSGDAKDADGASLTPPAVGGITQLPGTRKRGPLFAMFVALVVTYGGGWLFLAFSTLERDFIFYPMGNPLYLGAHVVVMALLLGYATGWGAFAPAEETELALKDGRTQEGDLSASQARDTSLVR